MIFLWRADCSWPMVISDTLSKECPVPESQAADRRIIHMDQGGAVYMCIESKIGITQHMYKDQVYTLHELYVCSV